MQFYAIYDKVTGEIYSTVSPAGEVLLPDDRAMIPCEPRHATAHKVNPLTLQFEQLPPYVPTAEELQEQIDALIAKKEALEG